MKGKIQNYLYQERWDKIPNYKGSVLTRAVSMERHTGILMKFA
jgi:hypothetical protein